MAIIPVNERSRTQIDQTNQTLKSNQIKHEHICIDDKTYSHQKN